MTAAKLGSLLAAVLLVFSFGFYAGKRWELPAVQQAQLALANQQKADATEVANANAQAAIDLAAMRQAEGVAMTARQAAIVAEKDGTAAEQATIAAMAVQPGQDGPVAPVLAQALASIAGEGK